MSDIYPTSENLLHQHLRHDHRRMGGGAHAESVIDRIVHNAVTIEMGDVNMRERCSKKMSARE
ncbi:hypothetical protein KQI08_11245 [Paraeggerthella hongkongensis]|uniref:hypothetical protein n=1 Tax=Paraeggerthella hominis TaxID=2897351 RepID=UPI001C118A44|nr:MULTISPECIES: hypothetical protein [Paraeggerthella]MBU5406473.1 hypothetical protein [Paraeggerthella hongkongensis]MCD2434239.1 hypothetical protein [Paraeggerthella hominis]